MNEKKWVVWGAGQIGRSMCRLLKKRGNDVIAIIDINEAIHGNIIEDVIVCDKSELSFFQNYSVCIAVDGKYSVIKDTLMSECGVDDRQIFDYVQIIKEVYTQGIVMPPKGESKTHKVIFQCDNGLGLGGVETWCLTLGRELEKRGTNVKYMVPAEAQNSKSSNTIYVEGDSFLDFGKPNTFNGIIRELVNNLPCTVVVNYKFLGYLAACMVKKAYPKDIKVISVVHGGKQAIFDWNVLYKDYVDHFIGVSKYGICDKLAEAGIEEERIDNIVCPVPIRDELIHTYARGSQPLQLAYAGRLTLSDRDKRVDLLIPFIEGIERKGINYNLKIAGEGDYKEYLERYVIENNLENKIKVCGLIDREKMAEFWNNSDIFVNVSDSEGNCMAMLEAMAQGCVPVLTDVSGVRDSIKNNYNGFIVERRDIETMIEKIHYLDSNRDVLVEFGKRTHSRMIDIYGNGKMIDKFEKIVSRNY